MAATITSISSSPNVSLEELENVIKQALKKTGVQKEMDLCAYLPYGNSRLSPSTYLRLKDTNKQSLHDLIKDHILSVDPHVIASEENPSSDQLPYIGQSLEECVKEAMATLNVQNESSICKYIPYGEGYIHHFTYMKMKSSNPVQIRNLIKDHILDRNPKRIPPKPRKRRHKFQTNNGFTFHEEASECEEEDLSTVIFQAMSRQDLAIEKEEDLCRYLPRGDSFLHPLAYRSLKRNNPRKLAHLIKEYVIKPVEPQILKWKKLDQNPSEAPHPFRERKVKGCYKEETESDSKVDQILKQLDQLTQSIQDKQDKNDWERMKATSPSTEPHNMRSRHLAFERCNKLPRGKPRGIESKIVATDQYPLYCLDS